jgi:DNA-binding response OmpR family regulator
MARILLVDDDDLLRKVLCLILTKFGHTVIEARDGKDALSLFPKSNADLLVTDLVMPEKEGFEILLELRKRRPPVKVIVISGGVRGETASYLDIAKRLGADKVLAKPFPIETLIATIDELMAVDRAFDVNPPVRAT